jgi:SAM-dependent methyltransferase
MPDLRDAVARGRIARHQIGSPDPLTAWSHTRRFDAALSLCRTFAGMRVLDYGCGDGTFLALAMMADPQPAAAVGAERFIHTVEECRERFLSEPRIRFVEIASLDGPEHTKQYDAVFCMEVLEHVFHWEPELARMARLLAPRGTLVVSVPVEIGVPVIIKQIARTIAGWRSIGYYPGTTPYSWRELVSAVVAGATQHIDRPVLDFGDGPCHDHKGFNWRVLRDRLTRQFEVTRIVASPFSWLGPGLATQVWLVCRLREDASK